ncbi:DUF1707 SHOCT-like domain-containing protein [Nonomuraea sp. KM90]|uniref:DUF1707 SHOCT-like domain-containing protein n=1 Tax=Nonomuraea sp. KM90 TaxID=3457428 RepID=UPI003FCD551B
MDEHRDVRASDKDRDAAAERLRLAVEEGCLDFREFDDRVGRAYGSVTRGELADLVADLPARRRPSPSPAPSGTPRWLKAVWAGWAVLLAVNVVVWAAVSVAEGCPMDFWPKGLLPPGLILAIVTAGTVRRRRDATAEGS